MTNVAKVMTPDPHSCTPEDSLQDAARLMWEHDCGSIPVVNRDGTLAGILTDRDICMAAYTQGKLLSHISIPTVMSREVVTCEASEPLAVAAEQMKTHQLRRLPIIDRSRRLVGILSLGDLARAASDGQARNLPDVGKTLAAVSAPRSATAADSTLNT